LQMLKELSELIGVSGGEHRVRDFIRNEIKEHVDEIIEDAYGNLIIRKGREIFPRIMLVAHMDEVGFMITGIEKSGLLKFKTIGISPHILPAKRVVIGEKNIPGVIGVKPIHQAEKEEQEKLLKNEDLFIDVGFSSKEEVEEVIKIGDLGTFETRYSEYNGVLQGKAFDDRIGCYILIQLIKNTDMPLYYVFTTQEEAGLRGARIAGYRVSPQIAIAVDTTASGEWPVDGDVPCYPEIGKGAVITVADRSVICDKKLVSLIEQTAFKNNIPIQYKKPMIGGTDAGPIHLTGAGVRTAVIQTAARYIHSPMSIVAKKDIDSIIRLLTKVLEEILKENALWS